MNEEKETMFLSSEDYALVQALRDAREQKKNWEEEEQRCRAALLECIGDSKLLMHNGVQVAEIENRKSTRFNRKLFAKDWPKLDEEYRTETESKVINIFGGDE